MSCESSSLSSRSFNIQCQSSGEYADAGYTLNLSRSGSGNIKAKLTTTTFAGESDVFHGNVNVLLTNNNSNAALVESKDRSLLIESKSSSAVVMKINNQNITDSFANLRCNDSVAKYFN